MDISFKIQGDCNVHGADHSAPIEDIKNAIETLLMEELGISASVTISDYLLT